MPMPWTYRHGQKEWRGFRDDIREVMGEASDNVAYTAAEGVFRAFRARLTSEQVVAFAQVLPAMPRALFVQGWDMADPVPWAEADTYVAEARAFRGDHNFANEDVLKAVSFALHRVVGPDDLRRALDRIGPEALAFWALADIADDDLRAGFR